MGNLSPWLSRSLAAALLVAVIAAILLYGVAPVAQSYETTEQRIEEVQELIRRYKAIAANRTALAERLENLKDQPASFEFYVPGETTAIAGAELQNRISTTVESAGGVVRSVQSLTVREESNLARIEVRAQFTGRIVVLRRSLEELETGRPLIFIDRLNVRRASRRRSRDREQVDPELLVALDAAGYRPPGDAP